MSLCEKHPKILGVTMDPLMNFGQHSKIIKDKVNKKNAILRSLAGSSWGMDKEVLVTTYKAVGKSLLTGQTSKRPKTPA